MYYLELVLFLIGFVLIVVGYRKSNRNILLAAAIAWLAAGALPALLAGVEQGYREASQAHSAS